MPRTQWSRFKKIRKPKAKFAAGNCCLLRYRDTTNSLLLFFFEKTTMPFLWSPVAQSIVSCHGLQAGPLSCRRPPLPGFFFRVSRLQHTRKIQNSWPHQNPCGIGHGESLLRSRSRLAQIGSTRNRWSNGERIEPS